MIKKYFNIDEISKLTGEKKHTIRFWEDRINSLVVLRTNTSHRLYNYENLLKINSHIKQKKHDMILKYDRHGCSHMFLHSFVKDKVACDERRREPTFEKIRFFERRE